MNFDCKSGGDYLVRECIDCLYRANNAHRASSWLDDLGLHMARTHWRAGAMYASLGNQHWEPAQRKTGRPVVIIPAVELTPSPLLVDLVAVDPSNPAAWWLRTGEAICLGGDGLWMPSGEPIKVRCSPLSWAKANGDGLCIIDPLIMRTYLTGHTPPLTLIPESLEHGNALERTLREAAMPRIALEAA
jgi:hypothetical protein